MILVAVALLGLLTVPLTGGRLSMLAGLSLQQIWAVWASTAIQVLITAGGGHVPAVSAQTLHLISFALSAWCLWSNRRLPGVWVVCIGGAMNLVAIAANGGSMPATAWAWRTAGLDVAATGQFENSGVVSGARLWMLGDVFAVPHGWPFANVFSSGDIVIVVGLLVLVHRSCRAMQPSAATADARSLIATA